MIDRISRDTPASVEQEQLWLLDRLNPGTTIYNEDFAFRLSGPLYVPAFERALVETVGQHPVLRTRFRMDGDVLAVEPAHVAAVDLRTIDLSPVADSRREQELLGWSKSLAEEPFSLADGNLVRYGLARLSEDDHAFVMVHHHAVTDLASFLVVLRDLGVRYAAAHNGGGHRELPTAPDYRDFAVRQRAELSAKPLDTRLRAWAEELVGAPEYLEVAPDHPRPAVKSTRGAVEIVDLPDELELRLRRLAAHHRVTTAHTLLATYVVLMRHHTGHDDMVLGIGDDGRPAEFRDTVGMFARLMPVRFRVNADTPIPALLAQVRDTTLQAAGRKMIPLSRLLNLSTRTRDPSRTPLVQLTFNIAPIRLASGLVPGLRVGRFRVPRTRSRFDISFNLEWGERRIVAVEYDAALYQPAFIRTLIEQFLTVAEQMADAPEARVETIQLPGPRRNTQPEPYPLETPSERSATPADPALERVVAECFEEVLGVENAEPEDDFFALGGHSMAAAELADLLAQELGVEIRLLTVFENPTIRSLAAALEARHPDLPEALARLMARLTELGEESEDAVGVIGGTPNEELLPAAGFDGLTPAEESFWVVEQIMPATSINVPTIAFRISGHLDLPALEDALNEVIRRQEVLRTSYRLGPGELVPRRIIHPEAKATIEVIDLSALDPEARRTEIARIERKQAERGFDVSRPLLLRLTALVLGEADHELLLSCHHMVVDKWSTAQVLFPALEEAYRARRMGMGSFAAPPPSFSRLAAARERWRSSPAARQQAAYWRARLAGLRPLDPPTDHPRPDRPTFEGDEFARLIPAGLTGQIRDLARSRRVTRFMVFTAALAGLLQKWSRVTDVQILTPSDNRFGRARSDVLGCLINMLVLRLNRGGLTWAELLDEVREVVTGAYTNKLLPFADVLREISQDGPALQGWGSYVGLNYLQSEHTLNLAGCRLVESRLVPNGIYACDLELFATEVGEEIRVDFRYRTALWTRATMENLADDLLTMLDELVADPTRRISWPRRLLGASAVGPQQT